MEAQPDAIVAAPAGFTDYVARFTHPRRDMRVQVYRATDEAGAIALALASLDTAAMDGWSLLDVVTVDEAIVRRGGRR